MKQPCLSYARLVGQKILLRPVELEDVPAAFSGLYGREEVLHWLVWAGPTEQSDLEAWYSNWHTRTATGDNYAFAIEELETGDFCGTIGLRFEGHPFQADLGYWLVPEKWGNGYMSEAVRLASHLAFDELRSVLAYATVFLGNTASNRVLEKNGFKEERAGLREILKDGEKQACRFYSLDRRSWLLQRELYEPVESEVSLAD